MKIELKDEDEALRVQFKVAYLAYRASSPMGMGHMHYRPNGPDDEAEIAEACEGKQVHMDYVLGRMVKLCFRREENVLVFPDDAPRLDYQSWSGQYPTYLALADAAIEAVSKEKAE